MRTRSWFPPYPYVQFQQDTSKHARDATQNSRESRCLNTVLLAGHVGGRDVLVVLGGVNVLLDLVHVDVGDGIVAVEDARDLLEGGALGLDVEEPDEDELDRVPQGVEQHEVPVLGEGVPRKLVGLAASKVSKG